MQFFQLPSSSIQTFSSALSSHTSSVNFPPLMSETKFQSIQNHRHNYIYLYANFHAFGQQKKGRIEA
jgi:hypothetical protein